MAASTPRTVATPGDPAVSLPTPKAIVAADNVPASVVADDASIPTPKVTAPLAGTTDQHLAAVMAQMAEMQKSMLELTAQNAQLARQINRNAVAAPPVAPLPTVAEAIAAKADAPVLTVDGWHVPTVTTSNPVQRTH